MAMSPSTIDDSRIVIIDFSPFLDGTNRQEVADKMLAAFKDMDFVYGRSITSLEPGGKQGTACPCC
jgi:hypothetical protein